MTAASSTSTTSLASAKRSSGGAAEHARHLAVLVEAPRPTDLEASRERESVREADAHEDAPGAAARESQAAALAQVEGHLAAALEQEHESLGVTLGAPESGVGLEPEGTVFGAHRGERGAHALPGTSGPTRPNDPGN